MKKNNLNLTILISVFVVCLIIANVVTAKTVQTGIPLFGSTIIIPGAVLCYALTFLMTDVIGEIWGRAEAQRAVLIGMGCQILATLLILLTNFLPATDPAMQAAYEMLLGQNWVFVLGSLTAYLCSQSWDVFIFHRIRNKFIKKHGDNRHRWIWNNASTMTSQIIDTVIFIFIAFGLGFGWAFDPAMHGQLFAMMVGQYLVKFLIAAADTPIFYLLTRKRS